MSDSTIEDIEPIIQQIATPWADVPVERISIRIVTNLDQLDDLAEGMDVLAAMFGRFGLDGFAIFVEDMDNPERQWVVKQGDLFTIEEFVAKFEADADAADVDTED